MPATNLLVKNDSGDFEVEVLGLSEIRGPAAVAQTLYRETEASIEARRKLAEERKAMPHFEGFREGKPSKRDRREIDRFRRRREPLRAPTVCCVAARRDSDSVGTRSAVR